jgi:hypothetical protein
VAIVAQNQQGTYGKDVDHPIFVWMFYPNYLGTSNPQTSLVQNLIQGNDAFDGITAFILFNKSGNHDVPLVYEKAERNTENERQINLAVSEVIAEAEAIIKSIPKLEPIITEAVAAGLLTAAAGSGLQATIAEEGITSVAGWILTLLFAASDA